MTAYYVQPEPSASGGEAYWLEGYAVGDAKFAAAQSDGTSTKLIASSRVKEGDPSKSSLALRTKTLSIGSWHIFARRNKKPLPEPSWVPNQGATYQAVSFHRKRIPKPTSAKTLLKNA